MRKFPWLSEIIAGLGFNASILAVALWTALPVYAATNPSATLSVVVAPPASGVACDNGPNYTPGVPAPAAAAGFTKCALNADFTIAGGFYANPANWLAECGAPFSANNTIFNLRLLRNNNGTLADVPCNRAVITTDQGIQVFDEKWLVTDWTGGNYDIMSLNWPADEWACKNGSGGCKVVCSGSNCSGGPTNTGLPQTRYVQLTMRTTAASWQNVTGGQHADIFNWWGDGCNGCGTNFSQEIDHFETDTGQFGTFYVTGRTPCCTTNTFSADPTVYHTYGTLITSDGTNVWICPYLDAGVKSHTPATTCVETGYDHTVFTGGISNMGIILANFVSGDSCFGNYGCLNNDVEEFIQSIQLFSCATYWAGNCIGAATPPIKS